MSERRPTEYQALKRFLYAAKDYTSRIDGAQANAMIYDSCEAAYEKLGDADTRHIDEAVDDLMHRMRNQRSFGRKAALELLAAIGDHMNGGDNAT